MSDTLKHFLSGTVEEILNDTSSGGVCINDCLFHAAVPNLPFGGVGASGMLTYQLWIQSIIDHTTNEPFLTKFSDFHRW